MNPIDDQLQRLFRAARHTPDASDFPAPFGFETGVLAAWRESRLSSGFWSPGLLARGMALAVALALASVVPALTSVEATTSNPFSDFQALADSTVTSDDTP